MSYMDINPIPTKYNGVTFRSRLEARWAVFFDCMGAPYQYEPQGIILPSGEWYLPDFYLPKCDRVIEIKYQTYKADSFAAFHSRQNWGDPEVQRKYAGFINRLVLVQGEPDGVECPYSEANRYSASTDWDDAYLWCTCPECGLLGIEFNGRSDRMICKQSYCTHKKQYLNNGCCISWHGDKGYTHDDPAIARAADTARSAKFGREHQETPYQLITKKWLK